VNIYEQNMRKPFLKKMKKNMANPLTWHDLCDRQTDISKLNC